MPTKKLPIRFTIIVPVGNPNFVGNIPLIKYLSIAPKNPPIPINRSSLT
ncbi:MAG: hypothetical protein PWP15_367 [Methanothermococcus sp.]|nr:hypothetical protein [Methanothermococcus sp.]MDK2987379.1 hypothetical protein [Methanothermococcus sp.]